MPSARTLLCLGLLVGASCTLGSDRTIVTSAAVSSVAAVATNTDGDLMFMGDPSGNLYQADPSTGAIAGSVSLWGGSATAAVAITSDGEDGGRVWSLHANGLLLNWDAGPTLTAVVMPPPQVGGARVYCDLDHSLDGDFYVTTVDAGEAVLWRRDGATEAWSSTLTGDVACNRIAHDLYYDELFVLRDEGAILDELDPTSLAMISTAFLDPDSGSMSDVDVFGGEGVGAGVSAAPSGSPPGGGGPLPSFRMAWSFDPETGENHSSKIISGAIPSSVHIRIDSNTSTAEALIGSTMGSTTVRGVALLED